MADETINVKKDSELGKAMADLDAAEMDSSKLKDNAVTFFKALQQMSWYGLKKYKYYDFAYKKEDPRYKICITIKKIKPSLLSRIFISHVEYKDNET